MYRFIIVGNDGRYAPASDKESEAREDAASVLSRAKDGVLHVYRLVGTVSLPPPAPVAHKWTPAPK